MPYMSLLRIDIIQEMPFTGFQKLFKGLDRTDAFTHQT
jgi:hypothetical protein